MKGSVTIALDDFARLEKQAEVGVEARKAVEVLDREISLLLAFMALNLDMNKVAEKYNYQSVPEMKLEVLGESCRLTKKSK